MPSEPTSIYLFSINQTLTYIALVHLQVGELTKDQQLKAPSSSYGHQNTCVVTQAKTIGHIPKRQPLKVILHEAYA